MNSCIHHRCRGVGAHATGIGAGVAFADTLVVLAGGHGQDIFAIDNHDEAGFLAAEELLNNHTTARLAKSVAREHIGNCLLCLCQRFGNDDAFSGSESVGFYHDGGALLSQVGQGRFQFGKVGVRGGGNIMSGKEILGESL